MNSFENTIRLQLDIVKFSQVIILLINPLGYIVLNCDSSALASLMLLLMVTTVFTAADS